MMLSIIMNELLMKSIKVIKQIIYMTFFRFFIEKKIEYVFKFRSGRCTRHKINRLWCNFGIRSNDTSFGDVYIISSTFSSSDVLATNLKKILFVLFL